MNPSPASAADGPSARPLRLGILGGSFDPPHLGHLHAARAAREAFGLDRVLWIPAARPPHKPGRRLVDGAHRVALVQLLIADEPGFAVDERELGRAGPSFTVDTLRELRQEAGDSETQLHLILGTDNLVGLPKWRDVETILSMAQPIVIHRDGVASEILERECAGLSPAALEGLRAGLVEVAPVEVSSTQLREELEVGGVPSVLLPEALRTYIAREGLYRSGP